MKGETTGPAARAETVVALAQGRVVAVFNNTRYSHEVEGRVRFVLSAGTDRTYEDGTHELEQVRLESYGAATARRAAIPDRTLRTDRWWLQPLITVVVLVLFARQRR